MQPSVILTRTDAVQSGSPSVLSVSLWLILAWLKVWRVPDTGNIHSNYHDSLCVVFIPQHARPTITVLLFGLPASLGQILCILWNERRVLHPQEHPFLITWMGLWFHNALYVPQFDSHLLWFFIVIFLAAFLFELLTFSIDCELPELGTTCYFPFLHRT